MSLEPERTQQYFRYLVERGAVERWGPFWTEQSKIVERVRGEEKVIIELGFCSYFLILRAVMDYCRVAGIVYGPGRGSVGGSAVAYALGIHEVDPLEFGLIFERFMNPERVAYPDVDIDLSQRDRQRIIDFVRETYEQRMECATMPMTLVEISCVPDVRPDQPQQDTKPATVAVLTHGKLTDHQVAKLENVVTKNGWRSITDPESLSSQLGKHNGLRYDAKSSNTMVAVAPVAERPPSTFSKWITSMAVAKRNVSDSQVLETFTAAYAPLDSQTIPDSKFSAPTVIKPRLVLVDARITTESISLGTVVLQVGALASAGGKSMVDHMVNAARSNGDPNADATGQILKSCMPEDLTGGTKQSRPLAFWLSPDNNAAHGDRNKFRETAEKAGWLEPMLKLDGMFTHIARHAAGVVILSEEDKQNLPQTSADKETMVTAFDMYDLEELGMLKLDLLGLRTLDVVADADRFIGGTGSTPDLMNVWMEHRNDPEPYEMLREADTLGIFQMETDGYRRTLRDFLPKQFDDIVHLNALYRPGAIDAKREDGKNMVEVFIDRRHGREAVTYPDERLVPIMRETHGIFLYQEQMMKAAVELADFTDAQADNLRRAIGKKKMKELQKLKPAFIEGCKRNGIKEAVVHLVWTSFEAAARYSWNKSHSVFYAIITWWTLWYKFMHPYAFYAALFNSYEDKKERLAHALSEARQIVSVKPPDINVAENGFIVNKDKEIVFGLNGVKGLGEDGRRQILDARDGIPFGSFQDFVTRLPSLGSDKKLSLIRCGAFDEIDERKWLLARCVKEGKGKKCKDCDGSGRADDTTCSACSGLGKIPHVWTVAEHINHNRKLKKPRPVPPAWELEWPTNQELSQGEADVIGFYISNEPLADVAQALARVPKGNHVGGEIEKIYKKKDRRKQQMANLTLLTPALTRQRVRIFASVWVKWEHWIEKGKQVVVRGRMDGDVFLADSFFDPQDYRHFSHLKVKKNDDPWTDPESFDGQLSTITDLEEAGYKVGVL